MGNKVGILIDRLNVGGVEKIAMEQVRALRSIGLNAELVVLCQDPVVENAFEDLRKDLPIRYLDERLPKLLRSSFGFPFFHFLSSFHITYPVLLPFVVKKHEYAYLIPHGTYTTLSAITLKWFRKIHFSAFIWDPATYILERVYQPETNPFVFRILRTMTQMLDRLIVGQTDRVLVGGDAHNKAINEINPTKPIDVIYPAVHPINTLRKKQPYILMATAWKRGKHPEFLVELAPKIKKFQIKMVGKWLENDYRAEYESLLEKHRLNRQIEIVGEVNEAELQKYYAEATVVLQTNDDRGFGMPALEAASKGTTFVIPEGQGVCKLFDNNIHGYYTRERDTDKIVEHLKKLMADPSLAKRMGKIAWEHVKAHYSWEQHAHQLEDAISRAGVEVRGSK